jgi:hypothetical protein
MTRAVVTTRSAAVHGKKTGTHDADYHQQPDEIEQRIREDEDA